VEALTSGKFLNGLENSTLNHYEFLNS
jgi:hypothetical protein